MKLRAKADSVGITKGHTYSGTPVLDSANVGTVTVQRYKDVKFVVYNDHGNWHVYDSHVFEPVEE